MLAPKEKNRVKMGKLTVDARAKMNELTAYTECLLRKHWKPCGLEDYVRNELLDIQLQQLKSNKKWISLVGQFSVEKATNRALALAKKWKKPECYYLNMALKNKWITSFYDNKTK